MRRLGLRWKGRSLGKGRGESVVTGKLRLLVVESQKKTALRRQEYKGWLAEAERADESSAGLEEEIKKEQEEAAKLTEKIEKLRSEKLDVYDALVFRAF
jgi:hypothetical protein